MNTVTVYVESDHGDGSFMIEQRIEKSVWLQMKPDATYWSADDLEDMDMFDARPGWRYGLDALRVLLQNGYNLNIRGQIVTEPGQLAEMFSEAGKTAYHQRIRQERDEAERQRRENEEREAAEVEQKRQAYESWKDEHLVGLVKTFALDAINNSVELDWQQVAFFDSSVGWCTTGDAWYSAEVNGETVYKCYYGNACVAYAPQVVVDGWCELRWQWLVETVYHGDAAVAARVILKDSLHDYINADVAKRLIEIHGAEHFVKLATATEWWIYGENQLDWEANAARHYGAPFTRLVSIPVGTAVFTSARFNLSDGKLVQSYWRHPDGSIVARAYYDSEYAIVTIDQLPETIRGKFEVQNA